MPFYLHQASGLLNGAFPWSINSVSSSSSTESAAQTAWDAGIVAMWGSTGFNGLMPAGTTLTGTSTSTANASFKQTTKTRSTHNTAGGATQAAPYHTAIVVTFRSAQATKYGHARWYLPGPGTTGLATSGYLLSATFMTDLVTAVNAFFTAITPTLQLVILHRKATLHGPGALTTDPIVAADAPNTLAVQRRRADKDVPVRSTITV